MTCGKQMANAMRMWEATENERCGPKWCLGAGTAHRAHQLIAHMPLLAALFRFRTSRDFKPPSTMVLEDC